MTHTTKPTDKDQRNATGNDATPARTDTETRLLDALARHPGSTTTQLAELAAIGRSTATKTLTRWADTGHVTRSPANGATGPRAANTWALPQPTEPSDTDRRRRLRPGELHTAVADYLAAPQRHGQSYTPGQIARTLGRSAGATTNALHRLVIAGTVSQTSERPRRFTHTPPAAATTTTKTNDTTRKRTK